MHLINNDNYLIVHIGLVSIGKDRLMLAKAIEVDEWKSLPCSSILWNSQFFYLQSIVHRLGSQ